MVHVESSKAIATTGVGRPDYTGEQHQAKVVKRLELHEDEVLKSFSLCATAAVSPYVWVVPPIVAGVPTFLIDGDTGLPMPYLLAAGYQLEVMMLWASFNENYKGVIELEGFSIAEFYQDALSIYYENEVLEFNTKYFDPDALFPHLISFIGENVGLGVMSGFAESLCLLRAVGTEKLTTKTIRCKWCGDTTVVPYTTTSNNCKKCGKLNLYYSMPRSLKMKEVKR